MPIEPVYGFCVVDPDGRIIAESWNTSQEHAWNGAILATLHRLAFGEVMHDRAELQSRGFAIQFAILSAQGERNAKDG